MVHALPYVSSGTEKALTDAKRRLETLTLEHWEFDWNLFAMMCAHNVRISPYAARDNSPEDLRSHIAARHKALVFPSSSRRVNRGGSWFSAIGSLFWKRYYLRQRAGHRRGG